VTDAPRTTDAPNKAVLLDVDGTLVDTNYFHVLAWWQAFTEHGYDVPMTRLHHLIGQGSDRLVESAIGRSDGRVVEGHSKHWGEWIDKAPALPGAAELIRRAKTAGLAVVLASSASSEELEVLSATIGAPDAIDHATSKDDAEQSKPNPDIIQAALDAGGYDPDQVILVGDTVWDVEAANRAGVETVVGVLTGGISEAELREAGAVEVYKDAAELCERFDSSALGALARR
jgi:HAD superfamily hydrolase (TIGR01509 family)